MRTEQLQCYTSQAATRDLSGPADFCRSIRNGSLHAETALVRKYERGLRYLVRHHTNDDEFAKEVVQETFIVVIQRLRTTGIDEPAKLSPFLHKTARNIMIGQLRKVARRRTDANSPRIEQTAGNLEDQHQSLIREQDALVIRQLLAELKCDRDRQILQRFYLLEEDKADICADLDLSYTHFNRVLYRARQRFGVLVAEYENRAGPLL